MFGLLGPCEFQQEGKGFAEDKNGFHLTKTFPHLQTSLDPPPRNRLIQHRICHKIGSEAAPSRAVIK